jgi:hypothetical protein
MRHIQRIVLVVCLAAGWMVACMSKEGANPTDPEHELLPTSETESLESHWTPEQMRNARPMPLGADDTSKLDATRRAPLGADDDTGNSESHRSGEGQ